MSFCRLTVGTLTALFAAARWGTERIGSLFGPVMLPKVPHGGWVTLLIAAIMAH